MKYIRTKSGIYEVDEKEMIACPNEDGTTDVYYKLESGKLVNRNDIIKESDSLEKLCDHLIVVEKGSSMLPSLQHRFLGDLFLDHSYDKMFQENKIEVYGAIWIKGKDEEPILKSVAKMNIEGVLELI